ncbi:MAG: serine/threonine protein kinase [Blastocatellia bacterium]|nr:serine/threonine protein kinase [Blastocatellia bacterium]
MDSRQIVGTTIAHFRILEPLASGGMASVYRALDVQLDRTVVLKILDADLLGEESARRRFLREARLASSLDHPNICTIYEIHEDKGVYYIAMQYVEGHTLKRTINTRPLAAPALLSIALQVADAVARAHDRGIIHRDIKPQNIMITPRGQAKVLDFGLGKNLEEATSHASAEITALGSPFGTPAYMSPEQARGDRTDRRGDVFSFGIVLYEMATGKKPFTGKTTSTSTTRSAIARLRRFSTRIPLRPGPAGHYRPMHGEGSGGPLPVHARGPLGPEADLGRMRSDSGSRRHQPAVRTRRKRAPRLDQHVARVHPENRARKREDAFATGKGGGARRELRGFDQCAGRLPSNPGPAQGPRSAAVPCSRE